MKTSVNDSNAAKSLVSIIIPVYNCKQYLPGCIKSVLTQSYRNFELILINDGSTDTSGKILDKFAAIDKRIKVLHKKNGGPADARNAGIKILKGEFIFFLDADDFIQKNTLDLLIKGYNKTNADIIIGNYKKVKKGVTESRNDISFQENVLLSKQEVVDYSRNYLKKPNKYLLFAFSWGRLFKSSIIKKNNIYFNTNLYTAEDIAFNFDYLNHAKEVYFLKRSIYSHLVYDDFSSATMTISDDPNKLFGYKEALISIANFLKKNISLQEIRKEVGHACTSLTIIQLVRVCGQINHKNKRKIYQFIQKLVNDSYIRNNLDFYSPSKGESKIIPLLIKLKLVSPLIWVCKYKAYKRYKR